MSIRIKLILAFLFTSLMAINLVAFMAHSLLVRTLRAAHDNSQALGIDGILAAVGNSLLIASLIAAPLSILVGVLLGARLSANLRKLTHAIQSVQEGHAGKPLKIVSKDEIGTLVSAFNAMTSEIAAKRAALYQTHEKLEAQAAKLSELAIRDGLTQLHNRRHFDDQLTLLNSNPKHAAALSIMLGDIDHFKQVNDTFSHATGDAVLREVGRILTDNTRASDLVARYGGEEFVIAFRDTDITQAHQICDKLRQHIAEYDWESIHPGLHITISMGVANQVNQATLEHVVRLADKQLYRAKAQGRNQVCSVPEDTADTQ
jgi:two-component system, cell cycle response regulator